MNQPVSRDARRGGILAGFIITGIGIVCLLVIIGISIARNFRVHENGDNNVSIETPAGNISIHGHDHMSVVDVPPYPGAVHRRDSGGGATFEWTGNHGSDAAVTVAGDEMVTEDSPEKVMEFYREQDPSWILTKKYDGKLNLELRRNGYRRFVVIESKSDGTHIGVASVGSPAAN